MTFGIALANINLTLGGSGHWNRDYAGPKRFLKHDLPFVDLKDFHNFIIF